MTWSRRELILAASVLLPTALVSRPGLSEGAGKRASIGKVDDLEGPAFRRNGQNLSPLHKGDPIFGDDELITGAGAKLQVRLGDGSILLLGAETSCLLASLALPSHEAAGDGLIVMGGGILRVILQGGGTWQSLSVESTTAIASVRGTDFLVESAEDNTAVFVVTGLVEVAGKAGGTARLAAGFGTDVAAGQVPKRASRWGEERAARALDRVAVWP